MNVQIDESDFPWQDTTDGERGRAWIGPMLVHGTRPWIENVDVQVRMMRIRDHAAPLTVNPGRRPGQAWVVSPLCQFVDYAAEETRELESEGLRFAVRGALAGLGALLRAANLDRIVYVDDWLVSTNLRPDLDEAALREATEALVQAFPDHALGWRSVHTWRSDQLDRRLAGVGYQAIPSRSVWLLDPKDPGALGSRNLDHDARLLRNRGYRVLHNAEIPPSSVPRLRQLYNMLYLDKYSKHNPWYTERFLENALGGFLQVRALERDGQIDGVLGFFERAGAMTTPIFGYDTTLPPKEGLYRMLSRVLVDEATRRGVILHQSAGAASFKRARRAESALEVTRVYTRHLPAGRRLGWSALEQALWRVAVPLVRANGL